MDWCGVLFVSGWIISGAVGGQMLNYPGDGITFRNFAGPFIGPIALFLALLERSERS